MAGGGIRVERLVRHGRKGEISKNKRIYGIEPMAENIANLVRHKYQQLGDG
jgi:hypothetical protein